MNIFVFLNTKKAILKNVGNTAVLGRHLTSIVFFFPTMEVNGAPKQPDYKLSSKYLPFVRQNKEIHKGLELLKGE